MYQNPEFSFKVNVKKLNKNTKTYLQNTYNIIQVITKMNKKNNYINEKYQVHIVE